MRTYVGASLILFVFTFEFMNGVCKQTTHIKIGAEAIKQILHHHVKVTGHFLSLQAVPSNSELSNKADNHRNKQKHRQLKYESDEKIKIPVTYIEKITNLGYTGIVTNIACWTINNKRQCVDTNKLNRLPIPSKTLNSGDIYDYYYIDKPNKSRKNNKTPDTQQNTPQKEKNVPKNETKYHTNTHQQGPDNAVVETDTEMYEYYETGIARETAGDHSSSLDDEQ